MFASLRSEKYSCRLSGVPNIECTNDELRHLILTYTTGMRANLSLGKPVFTTLCAPEDETMLAPPNFEEHTSDDTHECDSAGATAPSGATLTAEDENEKYDDDGISTPCIRTNNAEHDKEANFIKKNVVLAEIFAKELVFLGRTVEMISLIASRYQEEQDDKQRSFDEESNYYDEHSDYDDDHDHDDHDDDDDEDESNEDVDLELNDQTKLPMLCRSESTPACASSIPVSAATSSNQLATSILVGSGQIRCSFQALCASVGLDICLVYSMITANRPITTRTLEEQRRAGNECASKLFARFSSFSDESARIEIVGFFESLRSISQSAWNMMSLFAFTNLFRLTQGTEFELNHINPDDAIFPNRGRPSSNRMMGEIV